MSLLRAPLVLGRSSFCRAILAQDVGNIRARDFLVVSRRGHDVWVRFFGRKKPIYRFGHAPIPFAHPRVRTILRIFILPLPFLFLVDWAYVYKKHGIWIPGLTPLSMTHGSARRTLNDELQSERFLLSTETHLNEKAEDIHKFMIRETERRLKERSDEEEADRTFVERMKEMLKVKAKEAEESHDLEALEDLSEDEDGGHSSKGKKGIGFRNRKIIQYENRIRQYSTPDKIFRYFATFKVTDDRGHSEVMMTPEDFLRSITPGIQQPEHLGLDQFTTIGAEELRNISPQLGVDEDSIFHHLGAGGLISFSDYIFLLTVLSTSRRHFEIAFKMFDLNGDGNVDAKEFEVVTNLMRTQSSTGSRHRDHQNTGSTFKGINSALINYFFGESREGILTVDKFLEFQRALQNEILALEFKRKTSDSSLHQDRISEKDFAELLIAYAGFPPKKRARMLKRVRKEFGGSSKNEELTGVSLGDYLNFYQVLYSINDIDTALTFYHMAGAPIERSTMRHVAKTVAGVDLSPHVVDVVFVLFDENEDGKLSNREFVSVMKQRAMRGLEKPKDTGVGKVLAALAKCASDTRPTVLGGLRKTE